MSHGAGILLGLFPDMLGQNLGFLGYRRKLQRIQRIRFLFLARAPPVRPAGSRSVCSALTGRGGQLAAPSPPVPWDCAATSLNTTTSSVSRTATATPAPTSTNLFLRACSYQGCGAGGAGLDAVGNGSGFNVASKGMVSTINWSPRSAEKPITPATRS